MFHVDCEEDRYEQARTLVAAAHAYAATREEFDMIISGLLGSVLDHPWVDDMLESDIRKHWIEYLPDVVIVNDPYPEEKD